MTEVSPEALRQTLHEAGLSDSEPLRPLLCAVSGGLDSMVLIHLLKRLGHPVRAIHVDHAVHPDSASWASWVVDQLSHLGVDTEVCRLDPDTASGSLEEHWRNARRTLFIESLREDEVLVTAHHQNDQVETLLLQLLRGSGPMGLQAMPLRNDLSTPHLHVRPLLSYTREQLDAFARREGIEWIDDPSNTDERFARNYLRHRVLPLLNERWPGAGKAMARSRELIAESVGLNETLADLDAVISADGSRLDWSTLAPLDLARQANAVRFWLQRCGVRPPSRRRLREALRQWAQAAGDKLPVLTLEGGVIQRYRSELVFAPALDGFSPDWSGELAMAGVLALPSGLGELQWTQHDQDKAPDSWPDALPERVRNLASRALIESRTFQVRFRQGGEKLRRKAGHHQSLKHWFQESGVPPIFRDRVPLVFLGAELVAIADIWIDARFRPEHELADREKVSRLIWDRPVVPKLK